MEPSRFILGTCQLNRVGDVNSYLKSCFDMGVTAIDLGWGYGGKPHFSENAASVFIKANRDKLFVQDKLPYLMGSPDQYGKMFEEQLKATGAEYFDCYMLHAIYDRPDINEYNLKAGIEFLQKLKADGKVKSIGFSAHIDRFQAEHVINMADWDYCMFAYNVLCGDVARAYPEIQVWTNPGADGFVYAKSKGIKTQAMMPLESGRVMNITHDQSFVDWAIQYVLKFKSADHVLLGSSWIDRVKHFIELENK